MKLSAFTHPTEEEILQSFHVTRQGLSVEEAKKSLLAHGKNEITAKPTHWWNILQRQLTSPFLYLLIGAAGLSFFLGQIIDGGMILLFVGINTLLGFYQEYRSEKTLSLLKQYILTKAKVIRGGNEQIIADIELVPGDLIILEPGDIVPADVRLLEAEDMLIDESVLTGESVAVKKNPHQIQKEIAELYQATNMCFSGTTVTEGKGIGVVVRTGKHTAIGEIASLTVETKHESSFEKGIGRFSRFILQLVAVTLILLFLVNVAIKGLNIDIAELMIFSIALAVSVIPEALPVVMTFSLSRGALHLAKQKVVVKRLSAIEDLGSIEILCSDKTGTITENKLTVASIFPNKSQARLYAALASIVQEKNAVVIDAFDRAVSDSLSEEEKKEVSQYKRIKELPFDPERKRNSVLVQKLSFKQSELIVRGAPEMLISLCTTLPATRKTELHEWIKKEGESGRRVLAVAKKTIQDTQIHDLEKYEKELIFIGLISFVDPLKKTALEAIKKAKMLGVQVKILTGDSKEVAGNIGYTIGLIPSQEHVITGDALQKLSPHQQHEAVKEFSVFARVSPGQKHAIVQLLKGTAEVGFLGEGINDAPALKAANVGIVVHGAADIAREASDIILMNRSLLTIVEGIQEGREIFANTAKYIKATLASNFGNFYTVAITSLFIPFLPLLPLQILLLNLLTDFPMIAVAADTVDQDELKRPRNYDVKEIALLATYLGVVSSLFDFIFFVLFYRISPQVLQTNWFLGSALTEIVFLFSIRTHVSVLKARRPSGLLVLLSGLAFLTAIILPFTPFGHTIFNFVSPSMSHLTVIVFIVGLYFLSSESVKLLYYRFIKEKNT